ncbi:hypothetical protein [Selenomonas sp. oral taxon 920]|uniref:hypothetical protein n=1 Tax=Selenomonas sp. oral taxon 920 TaxID=1884263 RepID=UPI00131D1712|nr:hypothetical protein [Selenomonas sp. oral taxon 920]
MSISTKKSTIYTKAQRFEVNQHHIDKQKTIRRGCRNRHNQREKVLGKADRRRITALRPALTKHARLDHPSHANTSPEKEKRANHRPTKDILMQLVQKECSFYMCTHHNMSFTCHKSMVYFFIF